MGERTHPPRLRLESSEAGPASDLAARWPEGWSRLTAQVGVALRQRTARGANPVRRTVFQLTAALRDAGVAWAEIEAALHRVVEAHPARTQGDGAEDAQRPGVAETLAGWMAGWMRQVRQLEDPLAPRTPVSAGDRINVVKAETVLEQLPPVLERTLIDVRRRLPGAEEDEVLDRALRAAITELRFRMNIQTFEYLRWRVERLRAATG